MSNRSHDRDDHAHEHPHDDHDHYLIPFALISVFAVVEAVGSWYTGSLALLSDAGHMFSDVVALALAWLASVMSKRPNVGRHRSGVSYAELTVSIINAVTMLLVIAYVVIEAIDRFYNPHQVQGLGLTIIATLGLMVNLIVAKQLHHQAAHHGDSLNNRAAFLHVVGDLLGSVAAVAAGVVIYFTGWMPIDPILSLFISLLLLVFTLNLVRDIVHTLRSDGQLKKAGSFIHEH
jgi:cobalt-zinc-cadmium efflux system protein